MLLFGRRGNALWNRPTFKDTVPLQPKIVVETSSMMLLDDEDFAISIGFGFFRLTWFLLSGLLGLRKVSFRFVFIKWLCLAQLIKRTLSWVFVVAQPHKTGHPKSAVICDDLICDFNDVFGFYPR